MNRKRALDLISVSSNMMGLYHTTMKRFSNSDEEIEIHQQLQDDYLSLLQYCEENLK